MNGEIQNISWPGWETVRLIGRGSFGAVYEIQREIFGDIEKAALKVISIPQNNSDIDEMYGDGYDEESITSTFQSHLRSIVAEYSLMRKMNGSANIVNCDDVRYVQHDDGIGWDIYIKMELLTPLTKALPADIPEETVVKLGRDLCAALELCKKFEIVHRDIKPQNIFMSPNGDYKLGDFGIAKTVEKTMGGTKIGTYKYMAPEVYNNQPYGSAADIYSLGLVLYWMLNERRMPFLPLPPQKLMAGMDESARNRRLSGEAIPAPKNGSDRLKQIVLKACAYDVKDRYQSARAMRADLEAMLNPYAVPVAMPEQDEEEMTVAAPVSDEDKTSATVAAPVSPVTQPISAEPAQILVEQIPKDPVKPAQEKPGKKRIFIWIALGAVILAILLMLKFCGDGGEDRHDLPSESTSGSSERMDDSDDETTAPDDSSEPEESTAPEETETTGPTEPVEEGKVPSVVGATSANAEKALKDAGYKVTVKEAYDDSVASGKVISQEPAADTELKEGAAVTITVSLGKDAVTSIAIASKPSTTQYYVGQSLDTSGLRLKVSYKSGKSQEITSGYSCSPTSFSSEGTKTITVSYAGCSATFTVTVKALKAQSLSISTSSSVITYSELEADSCTLTASVNPDGGTVSWESSNPGVATVSGSGKTATVTAVTSGTATITATYSLGGVTLTDSCTITVNPAASTLNVSGLWYPESGTVDSFTISGTLSSNYAITRCTCTGSAKSNALGISVSDTADPYYFPAGTYTADMSMLTSYFINQYRALYSLYSAAAGLLGADSSVTMTISGSCYDSSGNSITYAFTYVIHE